jgi:chromosomal replication initiator protein
MVRAATAEPADDAPRYAMPTFVAGPENDVLATTVESLLPSADENATGKRFATLALFGASGTGKTHLVRGLVRAWQERWGADCAEYLTAADFRHTLREAIDTQTVRALRDRLRTRRLLALDDLDALPGDAYLQQELRSTIDALAESGGALVVASKIALGAMRNLSPDVRSRLMGGLVLRLAPPGASARERLVHQLSSSLGHPIEPLAAARLAAGVEGTANDVFGAVFEIQANAAAKQPSDERQIERFLAARSTRRPALDAILRIIAKQYGIPQKVLRSSSRRQSAVAARAMAIYLARELAGASYQRIGQWLGGRDHTTVLHSYRKIVDFAAHDGATRDMIEELRSQLDHGTGDYSGGGG